MRLIRTSEPSALGLQGMAAAAPIPCCEEIWGIRNGETSTSVWDSLRSSEYVTTTRKTEVGRSELVQVVKPEGIKVHRPLLSFPKADLVETCETNNVPYVTDDTNFDPTLTPRNAVRHLRSQYKLPRALQDQAILGLVEESRKKVQNIQSRGKKLLQEVSIRKLELSAGYAEVLIPPTFVQWSQLDPLATGYVIAEFCSLISPQSAENNRLLTPSHFIDKVVEAMVHLPSPQALKRTARFTVGKVDWEATKLGESLLCRVSRAVPPPNQRKGLEVGFLIESDSQSGKFRSKPRLWDFRYWIKLRFSHHAIGAAVRVRAFQPEDYDSLRNDLGNDGAHQIRGMLRGSAPGNTRYTLPVLTMGGTVIAFPTLSSFILNKKAYDHQISLLGCPKASLNWQAYYKAITEPTTEDAIALGPEVNDTEATYMPVSTWSPSLGSSPNHTPCRLQRQAGYPTPSE